MPEEAISISANTDEVVADILSRQEFAVPILKAMKLGMEYYGGEVVKKQMSGRHGEAEGGKNAFSSGQTHYGVNTVTGNLKRSVLATVNEADQSVKLQMAGYGMIHETGAILQRTKAWGKPVNPYLAHYPKRLHIKEEFKDHGLKFLTDEILKTLKEFFSQGKLKP